jgi:hypothetical protein
MEIILKGVIHELQTLNWGVRFWTAVVQLEMQQRWPTRRTWT